MRATVEHLDGRREDITFPGENYALGLAAVKHTCLCGTAAFVDGGAPFPPDERDPDRVCSGCGRKYWYYEDEDEQTGFLHAG